MNKNALISLIVGLFVSTLAASAAVETDANGANFTMDGQQILISTDEPQTPVEVENEPLRHQWFTEQRTYPSGLFPERALILGNEQAKKLPSIWETANLVQIQPEPYNHQDMFKVEASALGAWVPLGPAPIRSQFVSGSQGPPWSGRISAIAAHPIRPLLIYVASPGGGVWRTPDGGEKWTPLFDAKPSLVVNALAMDPNNPDILFAGTGIASEYHDHYYTGAGLFRTPNGGETWEKVGGDVFDGCAINSIAINPSDSAIILVAAEVANLNTDLLPTCSGGMYRSSNGGDSWERVLSRPSVMDVAFGSAPLEHLGYAGVREEGLYRSLDWGQTWGQISNGLPTDDISVVELAVAPSDPTRVYVVMGLSEEDPSYIRGVWVSDDTGFSWTEHPPPPQANYRLLDLAVDPADPDTLYIGSVPLFRSSDAGASFEVISDANTLEGFSIIHADIPALGFDASGRLLVGTDGGLYRLAGLEPSVYDNLNGNLTITQFYPGISGVLPPYGVLVGGSQDNGTLLNYGSRNWIQINGGDGGYSAIDPRNSNVIYVTDYRLKLYKIDFTVSPNRVPIGDPTWADEPRAWIAPFVMDLARPNRFYAGTNRVWQSINAGADWQPISETFITEGDNRAVQSITPALSDPDVVYAGLCGQLQVMQDGQTWTDTLPNGLPDRCVTDIAIHPESANEAYATVSGFGSGHVFHTNNFGATWTDVSGSLPNVPANAVAIDIRRSPPAVFVGTDSGVFVSFNQGVSWGRTGGGLPNTVVTDLMFDWHSNHLIAATYGRGMWKAPLTNITRFASSKESTIIKVVLEDFARQFIKLENPLKPGMLIDQTKNALQTGDIQGDKNIKKAINYLEEALNPELWGDDEQPISKKVFNGLEKAIQRLNKVKNYDVSVYLEDIVFSAQLMAQMAIEKAMVVTADIQMEIEKAQKEIEKAQKEMTKADIKLYEVMYNDKVENDKLIYLYEKAWDRGYKIVWRWAGLFGKNDIQVVSTLPENFANTFPETAISVTFDREIKPGSAIDLIPISSTVVDRSAHASVSGNMLHIFPDGPLSEPGVLGDIMWTVTIPKNAVTDIFLNSLERDYSWSFETRSPF